MKKNIIISTINPNIKDYILDNKKNYNLVFLHEFLPLISYINNNEVFLLIIDFEILFLVEKEITKRNFNLLLLVNEADVKSICVDCSYKHFFYILKPIDQTELKSKINIHIELLYMRDQISSFKFQNMIDDELTTKANIGAAIAKNSLEYFGDNDSIVHMNQALLNICGRTKEEILEIGLENLSFPDCHAEEAELFKKLKNNELSSYVITKKIIKPNGKIAIIKMHVDKILSILDELLYFCVILDISDIYSIEEALLESERSKAVLLSHLPGLAYRCNYDPEWTMKFVSDGCFELTGYHSHSLLNNRDLSFNDLIAPEYQELLKEEWKEILKNKSPFKYQYEIITASGKRKWVYELGEGIFNENNEIIALEGIIMDIASFKKLEKRLKQKIDYDSWTGLHNRNYLVNLISNDLLLTSYENKAIIGINISSFQTLTSIYGYHYSQSLIRVIVKSLKELENNNQKLFLVYENFLMFYLNGDIEKTTIQSLSFEIQKKLNLILNKELTGCGIGIFIFQKDCTSVERIFNNVLIAAETAACLDSISVNSVIFDISMKNAIIRQNEIKKIFTLISKVGNNEKELYLNYQPIVDLRTNKITGFEALARFKSAKYGQIPPLEFIPIIEKNRLIIPIGEMIINEALSFSVELNKKTNSSFTTAINISLIQILSDGFVDNLISKLKVKDLDPSLIILELTESAFSEDIQQINNVLIELRSKGIKIAIDDFGKGFSSLARESELSNDILKIDKSFIDKLLVIDHKKSIVSDIVSMTHKLGHRVIAEGVEDQIQKDYLIKHDCDEMQGFLLSKPLSKTGALEFTKNYNK